MRRVRAAGPAAVDPTCSSRQLAEGRCEVENQYAPGGALGRQPDGPAGDRPRCSRCGRTSSGAGSASSPIGAALRRATPTSTPSCASTSPACASPTRRPASAARCSRACSSPGSARSSAPPAPGDADRHLHGLLRGGLRGLLQLRSLQPAAAATEVTRMARVTDRPRPRSLRGDRRRRRRRRAAVRDDGSRMAHGAGGKASRDADRGRSSLRGAAEPAAPWSRSPTRRSSASAASGWRFTTDAFVVRPLSSPAAHRRARRQRHRQRPRGLRRPAAVPVGRRSSWRRASVGRLRAEVAAMAAAARARRRLDRHRRHEGRRARQGRRLYIVTTGIGVVDARRSSWARRRSRPGDAVLVSGPLGDHGVADHARPWRPRHRGRRRLATPRRCTASSPTLLDAAATACAACGTPTRGGVATVLNEMAPAAGVGVVIDEEPLPLRPRGHRCGRDPRHRPAVRRQRGPARRLRRRRRADAALAALRRCRRARTRRSSARSAPTRPGRVLARTAFGGPG